MKVRKMDRRYTLSLFGYTHLIEASNIPELMALKTAARSIHPGFEFWKEGTEKYYDHAPWTTGTLDRRWPKKKYIAVRSEKDAILLLLKAKV